MPFQATRYRILLSRPGVAGYKYAVDDERSTDPLADDPTLAAGVDDLDQELDAPKAASDLDAGHRPLLDLFPVTVDGRTVPSFFLRNAVPAPTAVAVAPPRADAPEAPPPSYANYYGLAETPFGETADPRFFYAAVSHDHVLNAMLEGIHERAGLIVLTGEDGLGKTMICRIAARDLDRRTIRSLVPAAPQSIEELLRRMLVDFGVVSDGDLARPQIARDALMMTLASFLKSLVSLRANAVVVIDQAHEMPTAVLAEIPAVVAEVGSPRLLQIVLAGAPALAPMVKRAGLTAVDNGKGLQLELGPLTQDDIVGYVRHRLNAVDPRSRIDLSRGAHRRLFALSSGSPQIINRLCERALVNGADHAAAVIDSAAIDRAAQELGFTAGDAGRQGTARRLTLALLALTLTGAAGAVFFYRDALTQALSALLSR